MGPLAIVRLPGIGPAKRTIQLAQNRHDVIPIAMLIAALALAACPSGLLTPLQAREDLELAIAAAETGLPDIYWRQSRGAWARRKATARALAAKATSEEELFRALAPLMRSIGEGHLSVARSDRMNCRYRQSAALFPLDLLWRDDGAYVTAGYGDAADIPPGSELLSVDGVGRAAMLEQMASVSAHDGDNRTGVMRDRGGRGYAGLRWWMRGNEAGYDVRLKLPGGEILSRRLTPRPGQCAACAAGRPRSGRDPRLGQRRHRLSLRPDVQQQAVPGGGCRLSRDDPVDLRHAGGAEREEPDPRPARQWRRIGA